MLISLLTDCSECSQRLMGGAIAQGDCEKAAGAHENP